MYKFRAYEIKLVAIHGSCGGRGRSVCAMLLSRYAILFPSVRMVCIPSRSRLTSSGVNPWVEFQYWLDTTGICMMVKYLFSLRLSGSSPRRRRVCPENIPTPRRTPGRESRREPPEVPHNRRARRRPERRSFSSSPRSPCRAFPGRHSRPPPLHGISSSRHIPVPPGCRSRRFPNRRRFCSMRRPLRTAR